MQFYRNYQKSQEYLADNYRSGLIAYLARLLWWRFRLMIFFRLAFRPITAVPMYFGKPEANEES